MEATEILKILTQAGYLSVSIASFALFILIASVRGKGFVDWMLMLRDLLLASLSLKFFLRSTLGVEEPLELRLTQWLLLAVVCLLLFYALVREHLVYREIYLKKKNRNK